MSRDSYRRDMTSPRSLDIPFLSFRPIPRWEIIVLACILFVGIVFRVAMPAQSYFNLHVERDLYRAMQLITGDQFPLLGSEMQYGGRIFGPLIYFIYAVPLLFSKSPIGVMIYVGIVNSIVLAACWGFARYWFGAIAALAAAALYSVFPLEIVQLRFMWNPCFLPALILGLYSCLYRYTINNHQWSLFGALIFLVLGFQIHFSVLMVIPVMIAGLVLAARGPRLKVLGISAIAIAVLFVPYMVSEFSAPNSNMEQVIQAPDAIQNSAKRYAFNPNAIRNFLHVITFDWNEEGIRMGFTYLLYLRTEMKLSLGDHFATFNAYLIVIGGIQFLLWAIGLLSMLATIFSSIRHRKTLDDETRKYQSRIWKSYILLILWQLIPLPFLCFFNFHDMRMGNVSSILPLRYFLISFPAQFIIAGIGFSRIAATSMGALRTCVGILLVVCVTYSYIDLSYLRQLRKSGIAIPYLYFRTPTLEVMLQLREILLNDFKINIEDYYNDVTGQNILVPFCGETTLDYLITQDKRAWSNPGMRKGTHLIVYRPVYRDQPPIMIADETRSLRLPLQANGSPAKILKEKSFRDITIYQVEGHLPREVLVFDPIQKTNVYYRKERMKYLGPDRP